MLAICAWCKANLGEKEPLDDTRITHSICRTCYGAKPNDDTPPADFATMATTTDTIAVRDDPEIRGKFEIPPNTVICPVCDGIEVRSDFCVRRSNCVTCLQRGWVYPWTARQIERDRAADDDDSGFDSPHPNF